MQVYVNACRIRKKLTIKKFASLLKEKWSNSHVETGLYRIIIRRITKSLWTRAIDDGAKDFWTGDVETKNAERTHTQDFTYIFAIVEDKIRFMKVVEFTYIEWLVSVWVSSKSSPMRCKYLILSTILFSFFFYLFLCFSQSSILYLSTAFLAQSNWKNCFSISTTVNLTIPLLSTGNFSLETFTILAYSILLL